MSTQKKIEVVEYNSQWPHIFEEEKSRILDALGDNCVEIHHVGSTSVPGLIAKPKIDIIAVANDREKAITALESIGYSHRGEWNIPLQCGFVKRCGTHVNLHMFFDKKHPEIELNLAFRDFLRNNEDKRIEYGNLKKEILSIEENSVRCMQVGSVQLPYYTVLKRNFIDNTLKKIGFNRLRVIKCLTEREGKEAERFYLRYYKQSPNTAPVLDFSDSNCEHFMLYQGVDICGYAMIQTSPTVKLVMMETTNLKDKEFFMSIINQWINIRCS